MKSKRGVERLTVDIPIEIKDKFRKKCAKESIARGRRITMKERILAFVVSEVSNGR